MTAAATPRVDDGGSSARGLPSHHRRIVILTEDSKPALGGIAEYLHQLALAASATHDVLIVTSVPGAEALNPGLPFRYREVEWFRPQHRMAGDGFMPMRRLNTLYWHMNRRRRARGVLAQIHADQPSSSYVVGRLSPVTRPWTVACDELGLPFSAIAYGLELVEFLSPRARQRRAATVARAAHWFAISRDTANTLSRFGVLADRQSMLQPGVAISVDPTPSAAHRLAVRHQFGLGSHPFLLSLCYLRRRKGIDVGIDAFGQIAGEFPDLLYVVAGTGPEQSALMELARARGVSSRVVFTGTVDEASKAVLLAECEFFVLPTRAEQHDVEGFGIVYLEAGLFRKAVIGGANGGVPDAVADGLTGILVDTATPAPLAAAERRLLRDPATAAAMGDRGYERARGEFRWSDRGLVFGAQLDSLVAVAPDRPAARSWTPASVVRVRLGMGSVSNRLVSSLKAVAAVARRGQLAAFLAPSAPPVDREACARAIVAWVRRAIVAGGGEGAAASYHVAQGWARAYPEITGYLLTTLLHYAHAWSDPSLADAAERAGSWLADIRLPGGAICRKQWYLGNTVPSVFNTAQVMEGWCALARAARAQRRVSPGDARDWVALARESGDWLIGEQEPSGSWIRHAFNRIPHTYYARVAGPLVRAAEVTGDERYAAAARRALDWVLLQQTPTGWFQAAGFTETEHPTTHTIGYVLEGLMNGGMLLDDPRYIEAADRAAHALMGVYERRGMLAGRFSADWRPRARWRCLTGDAQIAIVWCLLARRTGKTAYRAAAERVADGLRRAVRVAPAWPEISGGVQGSSPHWGDYDPFGYPTHAAKFTLDLFALLAA